MKVLGLFIELGSDGGVQRFGRHMALALSRFCRDRKYELELLSFVDAGTGYFDIAGERVEYLGCSRNRLLLQLRILKSGARFAYVNHAFIAPVLHAKNLVGGNIRYGVHIHGTEAWSPLNWARRRTLCAASFVTATSKHTGEEAVRIQGIKSRTVTVLYPPLDPCVNSGISTPPASRPYILTVSRMGEDYAGKRVDLAIKAFAGLAREFPEWQYVIVGSGMALPIYKKLVDSLGMKDRIAFAGRVSDEELMSYYRHCKFFLLPSKQEGLGIVFLEAMYHGRPAIGAPVGGTPEVVQNNVTGILADPDKNGELKDAMRRMMSDEDLRLKFGEAGRELVQAEFSYDAFEQRFHSLLAKEIGS